MYDKVNGMLLNDKKVFVGKFLSRQERLKKLGERAKQFTNVYIKNFSDKLDEEALKVMFENHGVVKSVAIMKDQNGQSKGFGFVAYESHEEAQKAVEALNGTELEGGQDTLYVGRAQKKQERQAELRSQFELQKQERIQNCRPSCAGRRPCYSPDDQPCGSAWSHPPVANGASTSHAACFQVHSERSQPGRSCPGQLPASRPAATTAAERCQPERCRGTWSGTTHC